MSVNAQIVNKIVIEQGYHTKVEKFQLWAQSSTITYKMPSECEFERVFLKYMSLKQICFKFINQCEKKYNKSVENDYNLIGNNKFYSLCEPDDIKFYQNIRMLPCELIEEYNNYKKMQNL